MYLFKKSQLLIFLLVPDDFYETKVFNIFDVDYCCLKFRNKNKECFWKKFKTYIFLQTINIS